MVMSNSPHPCSSMRNGGFLNAVRLSVRRDSLCVRSTLTLLILVEGWVQIVDSFLVDGGQNLVALVIQQPDLDIP
jgi:hypothetical protein